MVQNELSFTSHDGTILFFYRWIPENPPKAVLHIVHGMAEHALRYKRFAQKLTESGIEVWACDQRGHGKTADLSKNKPNLGGLLGHSGNGKSYNLVTEDIHEINKKIKETYPLTPLFLMGHSWGSFIVQNYIEKYTLPSDCCLINGCILSGTKGPGDPMIKPGKVFLTLLAFFKGQNKGSILAKKMADGGYNKPFVQPITKRNRTEFDWLSRDEEEVQKYIDDPLCGFLCSSGFYRDLTYVLDHIHKNQNIAKINPDLPVYVFSGSQDPVGDMGKSVTELVNKYRERFIKDIEFVLYPGARHECLNETNKDEVTDNLITWISRHCEGK